MEKDGSSISVREYKSVVGEHGKMVSMTQKREKEYVQMKESPRNESFLDGSVGARVRLMVRGGCLLVRGSERMTWKYDDCRCGCGLVETESHILFECTLYEEERERWRRTVRYLKDGMDEYELIKGYHVRSDEIEKETMRYMKVMWNNRQRHERMSDCEWE